MKIETATSGSATTALELIDLCEQPWRLQADDIVILASDGVETLAGDKLVAVLNNPARDARSDQTQAKNQNDV